MIKILRVFIKKTKELWNVYGGIAISTLIAWLSHWDKVEMDRWASYLILTLTCISVLTFFKIVFLKKKKANAVDKGAIISQKSFKTLKTAVDPMATGEEIGNAIIYTVKGGKSGMKKLGYFFKELWGNKFTLGNTIIVLFLATLSQVMTYTEYLYKIEWFAQNEIVIKIASPIIAGIWVFVDMFTTYTKCGFESLEEIAQRKLKSASTKMTKEEKKKLKESLKKLRDNLSLVQAKYDALTKSVNDFETLISAGYSLDYNERNEYDNKKTQSLNLGATIEKMKKDIEEIEKQL